LNVFQAHKELGIEMPVSEFFGLAEEVIDLELLSI